MRFQKKKRRKKQSTFSEYLIRDVLAFLRYKETHPALIPKKRGSFHMHPLDSQARKREHASDCFPAFFSQDFAKTKLNVTSHSSSKGLLSCRALKLHLTAWRIRTFPPLPLSLQQQGIKRPTWVPSSGRCSRAHVRRVGNSEPSPARLPRIPEGLDSAETQGPKDPNGTNILVHQHFVSVFVI